MKRKTILFFCMIFVSNFVFSQGNRLKPNTAKDFINYYFYNSLAYRLRPVDNMGISPKFYVNNLGFFCRQELKLQAITRVPVKFRLGSLPYNDWMEGKINAGIKPNN
jgi:hypothetical protein